MEQTKTCAAPAFTWDPDSEDPEVRANGTTLIWLNAGKAAIQHFVKTLSEAIGCKCDWSYCGGHAHVEVLPAGIPAAVRLVNDEAWMRQFVKDHDDRTEKDKTWLIGWTLTMAANLPAAVTERS